MLVSPTAIGRAWTRELAAELPLGVRKSPFAFLLTRAPLVGLFGPHSWRYERETPRKFALLGWYRDPRARLKTLG
jgi:hypothetical protein